MASSVIHMCVAHEVNKKINRNNDLLLIGSIAPDIAKHLGKTKTESHFLTSSAEIPNLDLFLSKYAKNLTDDFVLGYYIHLFTDYIWVKYFLPSFVSENNLYLLNGDNVHVTPEELIKFIYNDYTNLNILLIKHYNLNLKAFEKPVPKLKNIIKEIPMNQIQLIVDKSNNIIHKSMEEKNYVFNIDNINVFVDYCTNSLISNLIDIGYIKK
ncbi:MAG: hypothetical protein IJN03_01030 [Bacilli bacterium]|nr:hypothetical protein [Bacilli bacterium]